MSPQEIALIQHSWQRVVPIRTVAAQLFYGRLFELDPSLRPLFKNDLEAQGQKLMTMLHLVVEQLTQIESLLPAVAELGRRHLGYGVEDRHYDTVGQALLWTLEQGLGAGYTPEVAAAWTKAYVTLSGVMKEAAAQAFA